MGINQQLTDLYSSKWNDFLKMQSLLTNKGIYNYSSPLLMYCWENEYSNCNKKLLFIGQETDSWFDCGSNLEENSLNSVITNYEDFGLGYNYNSPFWRFVHLLNKQVNNSDCCYLWTNVNKFGQHGAEGRPDQMVTSLENSYFNILKDELEIIKPEAVIFLTGPDYDDDIVNKLGSTTFLQCTNDPVRQFAQLENQYLPKKSYRTYHPKYLNLSGLFDKYLNTLSSLIK